MYAHGFKHRYPECTVRGLSPELLSKPKPRVYELDGAEYVSSGVAPLDAGVLDEMVDVAESILWDYRHGFERVDDAWVCRGCEGIGSIVGALDEVGFLILLDIVQVNL
uniref:Uncharacterized protein n=1 Tax=Candidatus Methanogaster sp. ANME-2c ERB4 TaxID=2759911 RepID=A0A7G9YIF4_9EURY|nr:hypothetical protein FMEMAFBA_00046 [Methanosarcinales archaeon ANME-2c ERB4]